MIPDRHRPTALAFSEAHLHVTLANGRVISVSVDLYPPLALATTQQRANAQLSLSGIYWPELNFDLSLLALLGETPATNRQRKPRFCEG